jgi:hypothetical protein
MSEMNRLDEIVCRLVRNQAEHDIICNEINEYWSGHKTYRQISDKAKRALSTEKGE